MKMHLIAVTLLCLAGVSQAQDAFVKLSVNGSVITNGEASRDTIGNMALNDFADLLSYQLNLSRAERDGVTGGSTGVLQGGTLRLVKPLGGSSVSLRQAIDQNQVVDAELHFFQQDDTGGENLVYSIFLTNGYVTDITPWLSSEAPTGMFEAVSINFALISWEHAPSSRQHQIDFSTLRGQ